MEDTLFRSAFARNSILAGISPDRAAKYLKETKALSFAMWHGKPVATTQQMADYYEVPLDTVKSHAKNNREEFADRLKILCGKDLENARCIMDLPRGASKLILWTPHAALRLGMLLAKSEVAKKVRSVLVANKPPIANPCCDRCENEKTIKYGKDPKGSQLFRCKQCGLVFNHLSEPKPLAVKPRSEPKPKRERTKCVSEPAFWCSCQKIQKCKWEIFEHATE